MSAYAIFFFFKQEFFPILMQVLASHQGLQHAEFYHTDVSSVEPGLLARAVNSLKSVAMFGANVSKQQAEEILSQSLVNTSLKKLWIRRVNGGLNTKLVTQARSAIDCLCIQRRKELCFNCITFSLKQS